MKLHTSLPTAISNRGDRMFIWPRADGCLLQGIFFSQLNKHNLLPILNGVAYLLDIDFCEIVFLSHIDKKQELKCILIPKILSFNY